MDLTQSIDEIVKLMTLEEKASLCSGNNYTDTKSVERLGIPSITMVDGPHGVRLRVLGDDGVRRQLPATCFPPAVALGSTWNTTLLEKLGEALGKEASDKKVDILLGPGINIKRSLLCGRNFEYFSEDPMLSGKLGVAYVQGLQREGIGATVKHFAVNNQETNRMVVDAVVDEQTLHEIYLLAFEMLVKEAKPWAVMSAYNRVNGIYASEHEWLLNTVLRKEWGFNGVVISDWGAVDYRVDALKAGLDLEMPSRFGETDRHIVEAVKQGRITQDQLNTAVKNLLSLVEKTKSSKRDSEATKADLEAHHQLAKEIASEAVVLLKNEGNLLPLDLDKLSKVAIIGAFAKTPRFQGGGSSNVVPTKVENAYDQIAALAEGKVDLSYAAGYEVVNCNVDEALIQEAVAAAAVSEVAVVFVGLPDILESEGFDRKNIDLPASHQLLINEIAKVQKNIVVVLSNGGVVATHSWDSQAKAILEGWLLGQAGGAAIASILLGYTNPSGKLAETIPYRLEDSPTYLTFPGTKEKVEYKEGIFVGYRYYDTKRMAVQYPFGHGLSYARFAYGQLVLDKTDMLDSEPLEARIKVKNTSIRVGKEVIQLYVRSKNASQIRPDRELKHFCKIELQPDEEKEVVFQLTKRDFSYYDAQTKSWTVESGAFDILCGSSSRDIRQQQVVMVQSTEQTKTVYDRYTTIGEIWANPSLRPLMDPLYNLVFQFFGGRRHEEHERNQQALIHTETLVISKAGMFTFGQYDEKKVQELLVALNQYLEESL